MERKIADRDGQVAGKQVQKAKVADRCGRASAYKQVQTSRVVDRDAYVNGASRCRQLE